MSVGSQFAQYLNPLLAVLKELGGSARPAEAKAAVADRLNLSDEVLEDPLESGSSRFENQVGWARYYLNANVIRATLGSTIQAAARQLVADGDLLQLVSRKTLTTRRGKHPRR